MDSIALPIISIIASIAYIAGIVFKYGVPVSLSETYYLLPNKWDWLFSAWTVMMVPFGLYWYNIAPDNLKWMAIVTLIALLMIGVADCYKSGHTKTDVDKQIKSSQFANAYKKLMLDKKEHSFWQRIKDLLKQFNPKDFFKYGLARFLHYTNSLLAIALSTVYICMTAGVSAIVSTCLSYVVFIITGSKVDGVYNPNYSLDYNNSAWIFFMELVCIINMFVFTI